MLYSSAMFHASSAPKIRAPLFLCAALLAAGCGYAGPKMSVEELKASVDGGSKDLVIVDVRPAAQYYRGHVKGAVNLPLEELDSGLGDLRGRSERLAFICTCGRRALEAVKRLEERGISATLVVGGYREWEQKGFPLVRGRRPKRDP